MVFNSEMARNQALDYTLKIAHTMQVAFTSSLAHKPFKVFMFFLGGLHHLAGSQSSTGFHIFIGSHHSDGVQSFNGLSILMMFLP